MARPKKRSSTTLSAVSAGAALFEPTAGAAAGAAVPSLASVLQVLTHARIGALARDLGVVTPPEGGTKRVSPLACASGSSRALGDALAWMTRDELRAHGLPDAGRARTELAGRLQEAGGEGPVVTTATKARCAPRTCSPPSRA